MADLFAQPQGYGTAAHEALSEFQKEQRELSVFDAPFVQPAGYTHVILPSEQDVLDQFTVGPLEHFCGKCHLIHRLAVPCDE